MTERDVAAARLLERLLDQGCRFKLFIRKPGFKILAPLGHKVPIADLWALGALRETIYQLLRRASRRKDKVTPYVVH